MAAGLHKVKEADMADDGDKRTYPRLPAKNWWALRERFKQTMPGRVDADYLQSVLGLTSAASAGNLVGPLRTLGLIDGDGRPTNRALDWRQDESYGQVCEEMLADVYPDTLRSAFPDPSVDHKGVTSWFSRNTGAGQNASSGMAALYTLISSADPEAGQNQGNVSASTGSMRSGKPARTTTKPKSKDRDRSNGNENRDQRRRVEPALNVNVQVHISADASADQIDQIFKSMAEHLYGGE